MTGMWRALPCVLAGLVIVSAQPAAQRGGRAAPDGTAALGGRVVAADTGVPLREAEVTLESSGRRLRRSTLTDANGEYRFTRLPDGEYTVRVAKAGFVRLAFGQRYAFGRGTPVTLTPGARLDTVNLALPRGSVITVRVTDDRGEPLAGATVRVQQFAYRPDGQRQLTAAGDGAVGNGTTDDRGEFRAYGLLPGEYVVGATPGRTPEPAARGEDAPTAGNRLAPTFYPGTISVDRAAPVSVGVGEDTGIQISMMAARLGRISGTVVDSRGRPAAGARIQAVTHQDSTVLTGRNLTRAANDGTFSIGELPPGEHWLTILTRVSGRGPARLDPDTLQAELDRAQERLQIAVDGVLIEPTPDAIDLPADGERAREREFASLPVVVSGDDVAGLYIVTRPGIDVRGTVALPAGASLPRPLRVRAEALGNAGNTVTTDTLDSRAFELSGVAGRVLIDAIVPRGWAVASVTLGGRDVTEEPIDLNGLDSLSGLVVSLTSDPTRVEGGVVDEAGRALRDYVVVVQPSEALSSPEATNRRVRALRPDGQGRFETGGLPPGRYLATAVPALQEGREYSPELRERLRAYARELVLRPGDHVALDLPVTLGL